MKCPICETGNPSCDPPWGDPTDTVCRIVCKQCGTFSISARLAKDFSRNEQFKDFRHLASAWIYRQGKVGNPVDLTRRSVSGTNLTCWESVVRLSSLPITVGDKKDAFLLALAAEVEGLNGRFDRAIELDLHKYKAETASRLISQVKSIADYLQEDGLVVATWDRGDRGDPNAGREVPGPAKQTCSITSQGWQRVQELRRTKGGERTAFVALWFSDATLEYRTCVAEAVREAGYEAVIVDQEHFNHYIMDKVIASIRQARFLIADFTSDPETDGPDEDRVRGGVRGGVYYEAGFAKGMEKEVIHTCRDDPASRKRLHFDIAQINTIFWREADGCLETQNGDFREELRQRILATIGMGPIPHEMSKEQKADDTRT